MTDSDSLTQFLLHGEQLLFSCEKAAVKRHHSRGILLATGGGVYTSNQQRLHDNVSGPLAITDKRLFLVEGVVDGIFSSHPGVRFQAVYDSEYARQIRSDILAEASPQKVKLFEARTLGDSKDYLLLRNRSFGGSIFEGNETGVTVKWDSHDWELRLKKPLVMIAEAKVVDLANAGTGTWYAPILAHSKGKADAGYSPILEIMLLKSPGISSLVREFESGSTKPPAATSEASVAASTSGPVAAVTSTGSWLDNYLEPGERVQYQSMSEIRLSPSSLSLSIKSPSIKRCKVVLTDRKLLIYSEHGTLKDGQNVIIQKLDDVREVKYHKIPLTNGAAIWIQGSSAKIQLDGMASELEVLQRHLENRRKAST